MNEIELYDACPVCHGTGKTGAAISLETYGPEEDAKRLAEANRRRVPCAFCGGEGAVPHKP